jgi:hypothetical protein
MNRFRRGRNVSQWAGVQTGPMTVDVDAVWANRDRNPVPPHPVNPPVPHPVNAPAKYVSPLTAYLEYELNKTNASTQLAPPAQNAAPEVAHTAAAEATQQSVTPPQRQDTTSAVPSAECERSDANIHTEDELPERANANTNLLDSLPAFKAAIESFEKRGDPIMVSVDPEPSDAEAARTRPASSPEYERSAASIHTEAAVKAERAKRTPRPIPTLKQVTVRPSAPRPQSQPKSQNEIDLAHHERRCSICHHPDREAIEEAFLQWRRVKNIDSDFKPDGGPTAIYRHARALNLFKQRNLHLRTALEFVIERAENVIPTAEGLVKAIHAYTRINDQGEWIDTPTTHIVKVMPIVKPGPRNVTPATAGNVTLDVKKISDCPREGRVEVSIESPSGRPLLTGSAPQTESRPTPTKQRKRKFLTGARTHIRLFGKLANSVSKIWRRSAQ